MGLFSALFGLFSFMPLLTELLTELERHRRHLPLYRHGAPNGAFPTGNHSTENSEKP
jgi:hypothetical protein